MVLWPKKQNIKITWEHPHTRFSRLVFCKFKSKIYIVFLTSPFLSCQGLGLTRSSTSGRTGGLSSSLTLDEDEESEGGTGELEGHSVGRIILAGIRAPTTASLGKHTTHPVNSNTHWWQLPVPVCRFNHLEVAHTFSSSRSEFVPQRGVAHLGFVNTAIRILSDD